MTYSIHGNIDAEIAPGTTSLIATNAAVRWSTASQFELARVFDPTVSRVTTFDRTNPPWCGYPGDETPGLICARYDASNNMRQVETFLSRDTSLFRWNTSNIMCYQNCPNPGGIREVDVLTVVLHEFGHWMYLNHDCTDRGASMCVDWELYSGRHAGRQRLSDDDKQGATQIYGPWTGFEYTLAGNQPWLDQAQGHANRQSGGLSWGVRGYNWPNNNPPTPRLFTTPAQDVPVYSLSMYARLEGYADDALNPHNVQYFKLFTNEVDYSSNPVRYLTIRPGMRLKWYQYNAERCCGGNVPMSNASVDFKFRDGSYMRDYRDINNQPITDQLGTPIHPAARGGYPAGQWLYFEANLDRLNGREITDVILAFDDGNSNRQGRFRVYFDELQIVYRP